MRRDLCNRHPHHGAPWLAKSRGNRRQRAGLVLVGVARTPRRVDKQFSNPGLWRRPSATGAVAALMAASRRRASRGLLITRGFADRQIAELESARRGR